MKTGGDGRIGDCVILAGRDLEPLRCRSFEYEGGRITRLETDGPAAFPPVGAARVLVPGFVNAHTHAGDAFLADAATGMTLEEAFFRPNGFKYRMLADTDRETHVDSMAEYLRGMAATGTVAHVDFREQGEEGASRLREASARSGVRSVILGQLDRAPFDVAALEANEASLPEEAGRELSGLLGVADGFSESTMNDWTDAAWDEARAATDRAGKLRAIHCLESAEYRETSVRRTGRGDLARALEILRPHFVVHLTVANPEEIALLAASGTPAVVNPRANAALGLPFPPLARLLGTGAPVLLGTDNGMLNGPSLLPELDCAYRLARSQAGEGGRIAPREILRMATGALERTPLGPEFPGRLETGLPAHFFEVDFSSPHLRSSRDVHAALVTRLQPSDIRRTVRSGQPLFSRP